jgi:hypothetical protein
MTIVNRLYILMITPVLLLVLLGALMRHQFVELEQHDRFLAENVTPSLALLAHIGHANTQIIASINDHLRADTPDELSAREAAISAASEEIGNHPRDLWSPLRR